MLAVRGKDERTEPTEYADLLLQREAQGVICETSLALLAGDACLVAFRLSSSWPPF